MNNQFFEKLLRIMEDYNFYTINELATKANIEAVEVLKIINGKNTRNLFRFAVVPLQVDVDSSCYYQLKHNYDSMRSWTDKQGLRKLN